MTAAVKALPAALQRREASSLPTYGVFRPHVEQKLPRRTTDMCPILGHT
jgi:hypothetical protein